MSGTTFLRITTTGPDATEAACQALHAIGLGGFGAHSCGPTVRTPDPQLAAKALSRVSGVHGCWSGTTNLLDLIGA